MKKVRFKFKLVDLWVGAFVDKPNKRVYLCPVPCCCFIIDLQ